MSKLVIAVFLVTLAVGYGYSFIDNNWPRRDRFWGKLHHGAPYTGNDFAAAAAAGNWQEFHRLITANANNYGLQPFQTVDVKNLKPIPGGHVYGQSQQTFHSSTFNNGYKTEQSGGHKVINDNGKITEYDFTPQVYNGYL